MVKYELPAQSDVDIASIPLMPSKEQIADKIVSPQSNIKEVIDINNT